MTTQSDVLREALFGQMSASPLPEYSGDAVILRACKTPLEQTSGLLKVCNSGQTRLSQSLRSTSSPTGLRVRRR